jgi:hypothetical protein
MYDVLINGKKNNDLGPIIHHVYEEAKGFFFLVLSFN